MRINADVFQTNAGKSRCPNGGCAILQPVNNSFQKMIAYIKDDHNRPLRTVRTQWDWVHEDFRLKPKKQKRKRGSRKKGE